MNRATSPVRQIILATALTILFISAVILGFAAEAAQPGEKDRALSPNGTRGQPTAQAAAVPNIAPRPTILNEGQDAPAAAASTLPAETTEADKPEAVPVERLDVTAKVVAEPKVTAKASAPPTSDAIVCIAGCYSNAKSGTSPH